MIHPAFKMKIAITFDIEPDLHSELFRGISEGIPKILKILAKYNIKATFFASCDCIEKYPKIFQNLKRQGHEIALHGYQHERFDDLSIEQKEKQITKSITCFKKYLKAMPKGFRAPQHSIDKKTLKMLSKYNLKYDSSKTPLNAFQFLFFPKRIKANTLGFFSNPHASKMHGVLEIPATSFLMPFVSLFVRILPKSIIQSYIQFLSAFFHDLVFYAHSWDFIKISGSKIERKFPHEKFIRNFEGMIEYLKNKEYTFVKMEELYEENKNT